MTFHNEKAEGKRHRDIVIFRYNTSLLITQGLFPFITLGQMLNW